MEVLGRTIKYTRVSDRPEPSLIQRRTAGVDTIDTNVVHDSAVPAV